MGKHYRLIKRSSANTKSKNKIYHLRMVHLKTIIFTGIFTTLISAAPGLMGGSYDVSLNTLPDDIKSHALNHLTDSECNYEVLDLVKYQKVVGGYHHLTYDHHHLTYDVNSEECPEKTCKVTVYRKWWIRDAEGKPITYVWKVCK